MPLTATYHTLGCKLNFAETASIARSLESKGIQQAKPGEHPDLVIVNTCSVTELADKKSRQYIRSMAKRHPNAKIIVTGCYSQLKSDEASNLPGVSIIAGNDQKDRIADFIDRLIAEGATQVNVAPSREMRRFVPSCSRGDRTRYFLKVQDGCDYYCTYCTIPIARGRSRSGTIEQIVAQANEAAANGAKEIVITGVNIGDFGKGRDDRFIDLIRELDRVDGISRYRISSIEPNLLSDEIIDFVATSRAFMPHFHIPLQSGSDTVLKLMHRHYDTTHFKGRIQRIRSSMPDAFIGVDLITGARGETREEFERSRDFIASLDITKLHIFPYSERPGTRALGIEHVVSQEEKHQRAKEMAEISDAKLDAFTRRFAGTQRPVLLEHSIKGKPMSGFTDNYLKVYIEPSQPQLDNHIVNVNILSPIAGGEMKGEIAL